MFFLCGQHKLSNLRKWFKKFTEGGSLCAPKLPQDIIFTQTFDAILYLNKCTCAPILNFSPQCPIGSTAKGGISNRVFLAIFPAIFRGFWRTL